jgi:hypothetical protein
MSAELAGYLSLLVAYLIVAAGVIFAVWRATFGLALQELRVALRAFTLAFLLAPGAVACGGASIVPFSLVVVADVLGYISPNGCGPYTPMNLVSFLPALAVVATALYLLERHGKRRDAL